MMSYARVTLAGTLLQVPEKRFTPNNAAVSILQLAVPVPAKGQQAASQMVVKVVCWRGMADAVSVLQAGHVIHVEGRLQLNTVTTPEGVQKKMFEVDAQTIHVLPGLPTQLEVAPMGAVAQQPQQPPAYQQPQMAPQPMQQQPAYQTSPMPQPAVGVTAASPTVNLTDLSADDFLTEDDIPF
jgi:single stranded DNA-binding protein